MGWGAILFYSSIADSSYSSHAPLYFGSEVHIGGGDGKGYLFFEKLEVPKRYLMNERIKCINLIAVLLLEGH